MNTIGFDKCCCIPWHCIEWKFMCGMWMDVLQCLWGHLNTAVTQCARTWVSTLVFAKFFVLFFCVHRCGRWLLLLMMIVNIIISHSAERRHAQQPQIKRFITWRSHTRSDRHRHNHFSCRLVYLSISFTLATTIFLSIYFYSDNLQFHVCDWSVCAAYCFSSRLCQCPYKKKTIAIYTQFSNQQQRQREKIKQIIKFKWIRSARFVGLPERMKNVVWNEQFVFTFHTLVLWCWGFHRNSRQTSDHTSIRQNDFVDSIVFHFWPRLIRRSYIAVRFQNPQFLYRHLKCVGFARHKSGMIRKPIKEWLINCYHYHYYYLRSMNEK